MKPTIEQNNNRVYVGGHVKVQLKGEAPWVEILEIHDNGLTGRIDNKTFAERSDFERAQFMKAEWGKGEILPKLHDYKFNDVVRFRAVKLDDYVILVPEGDLHEYTND